MKRQFIAAVAAIGCAVALSGCGQVIELGSEEAPDNPEGLKYVQDERTGLCFAYDGAIMITGFKGVGMGMLAEVPCTPEVLELVEQTP